MYWINVSIKNEKNPLLYPELIIYLYVFSKYDISSPVDREYLVAPHVWPV